MDKPQGKLAIVKEVHTGNTLDGIGLDKAEDITGTPNHKEKHP